MHKLNIKQDLPPGLNHSGLSRCFGFIIVGGMCLWPFKLLGSNYQLLNLIFSSTSRNTIVCHWTDLLFVGWASKDSRVFTKPRWQLHKHLITSRWKFCLMFSKSNLSPVSQWSLTLASIYDSLAALSMYGGLKGSFSNQKLGMHDIIGTLTVSADTGLRSSASTPISANIIAD